MNIELLNRVKKLVIIALASDDNLMEELVLKGGNAIDLIHPKGRGGLSRTSFDLDFSIDGDFDEDIQAIASRIERLLMQAFAEQGYILFDYSFKQKPTVISERVADFWGGYKIEFKIIEKSAYDMVRGTLDQIRRIALPMHSSHSPRFEVEISKYEYVKQKVPMDVDGYTIYVYSPEMIVFEKLRALCQQLPEYAKIIPSHSPRARARDFYDIHLIMDVYAIDPSLPDNHSMIRHIFEAKKVPLRFIQLLRTNKSLHKEDWKSVIDTVSAGEDMRDFDFYFEYVLGMFEPITFL
jgi:predicted nucleotidyltransferase component of viral defense system